MAPKCPMSQKEEPSAKAQLLLSKYEERLGGEVFQRVPEVQLSADRRIKQLVSVIEETPIHWEAVFASLQQYPMYRLGNYGESDLVGAMLDEHLHLVLSNMITSVPWMRDHRISDQDQTEHYRFYPEYLPHHGVFTRAVRTDQGNSIDYSEYDHLTLTALDEQIKIPTIWEAKMKLMHPDSVHVDKRVCKIFQPEVRKYWLHPITEFYRTDTLGVVAVTTRNESALESDVVKQFLADGGLLAFVPHTLREYQEGVKEIFAQWTHQQYK